MDKFPSVLIAQEIDLYCTIKSLLILSRVKLPRTYSLSLPPSFPDQPNGRQRGETPPPINIGDAIGGRESERSSGLHKRISEREGERRGSAFPLGNNEYLLALLPDLVCGGWGMCPLIPEMQ